MKIENLVESDVLVSMNSTWIIGKQLEGAEEIFKRFKEGKD